MTPPRVCDYEGSDYQQSFWDQGGREYEDRCEEIALKRLLPEAGDLMLELGAGAGRNTERYSNFKKITLLDYSRTQLEEAQKRLGGSDRYIYVAANIYHLPFVDGLFDGATMIRTLHHMDDAPAALQQVRKVLQPGAAFILEYANKQNIKAIFRYLLNRQKWNPFALDPVEFATLNFNFHPRTIRTWLRKAGFNPQKILTVSHFRTRILKRLIPPSFLASVDSIFQWSGSLWQLTPSVFVKSLAVGSTPVSSSGSFFKCPICSHNLMVHQPEQLTCPQCGHEWKFQNGIYDFRWEG